MCMGLLLQAVTDRRKRGSECTGWVQVNTVAEYFTSAGPTTQAVGRWEEGTSRKYLKWCLTHGRGSVTVTYHYHITMGEQETVLRESPAGCLTDRSGRPKMDKIHPFIFFKAHPFSLFSHSKFQKHNEGFIATNSISFLLLTRSIFSSFSPS